MRTMANNFETYRPEVEQVGQYESESGSVFSLLDLDDRGGRNDIVEVDEGDDHDGHLNDNNDLNNAEISIPGNSINTAANGDSVPLINTGNSINNQITTMKTMIGELGKQLNEVRKEMHTKVDEIELCTKKRHETVIESIKSGKESVDALLQRNITTTADDDDDFSDTGDGWTIDSCSASEVQRARQRNGSGLRPFSRTMGILSLCENTYLPHSRAV